MYKGTGEQERKEVSPQYARRNGQGARDLLPVAYSTKEAKVGLNQKGYILGIFLKVW